MKTGEPESADDSHETDQCFDAVQLLHERVDDCVTDCDGEADGIAPAERVEANVRVGSADLAAELCHWFPCAAEYREDTAAVVGKGLEGETECVNAPCGARDKGREADVEVWDG